MAVQVVEVTDPEGNLLESGVLALSEPVHRQLRGHLPGDYRAAMANVFSGGGRMLTAVEGDSAVGVAVYRIFVNTALGRHMYVDDLVTDESCRSKGVGRALMERLCSIARRCDCANVTLDSGTHRLRAHKFYFREGFLISSFHFHKSI